MDKKQDLIGTSFGLATTAFHGKGCEQVYVRETADKKRPILIEFWEGYAIPNKAVLTRNQAVQMALLIIRWATGVHTEKV